MNTPFALRNLSCIEHPAAAGIPSALYLDSTQRTCARLLALRSKPLAPGTKETAKGIANMVSKGTQYSGEKLKEARKAGFGHSVKGFA